MFTSRLLIISDICAGSYGKSILNSLKNCHTIFNGEGNYLLVVRGIVFPKGRSTVHRKRKIQK